MVISEDFSRLLNLEPSQSSTWDAEQAADWRSLELGKQFDMDTCRSVC